MGLLNDGRHETHPACPDDARSEVRIYDRTTGKSYFQKRRQRFDEFGQARELTFSCFRGFQFLSRDRTRNWFIDALSAARSNYPLDLWAYVIMPEHVHVLVYPRKPGMKLGPIAGRIKEEVARPAIRYLTEHAPEWLSRVTVPEGNRIRHRFWQPGGGFDRNAVEIETIHHMINYIHANPVRRGLVQQPEDWH